MPPLLTIKGLSKSFGNRIVFNDLNLLIEDGKAYALFGGNGSGKTTLFNILTGFVKADRGVILFKEFNLSGKSAHQISRAGIQRTFQDLRIIQRLSVEENILLSMGFDMWSFSSAESLNNLEKTLEEFSLLSLRKQLASELSFGQQKLLTLACCVVKCPRLLLLDEPIAGIDEHHKILIEEIVLSLSKKGMTIFQIEHDLDYIESTSSIYFHLFDGKIVDSESIESLRRQEAECS